MSQINTELGRSSTAGISLNSAEDGGYATINGCSIYRPSSPNPASMSEWYRYNHSAACTACDTDISLSFSSGPTTYYFTEQSFSMTSLGNFNPILYIDTCSANVYVYVNIADAATGYGLGDFYLSNVGVGTYTFDKVGVYSTGPVIYQVSIQPYSYGTVTGTIRMRVSCPAALSCGTTLTGVVPYCGGTYYSWIDLGTTSRTVTVTYTAVYPGGGNLTTTVNYAGSNQTLTGSTGWGTNNTFTFPYTYNGSATLARVAFNTDNWC